MSPLSSPPAQADPPTSVTIVPQDTAGLQPANPVVMSGSDFCESLVFFAPVNILIFDNFQLRLLLDLNPAVHLTLVVAFLVWRLVLASLQ